jgi:hypothetical protein
MRRTLRRNVGSSEPSWVAEVFEVLRGISGASCYGQDKEQVGQELQVDLSRARAGYVAENLATLRRRALNLLKREKTKRCGIKGKQLNASWDHAYLLRLLGVQI